MPVRCSLIGFKESFKITVSIKKPSRWCQTASKSYQIIPGTPPIWKAAIRFWHFEKKFLQNDILWWKAVVEIVQKHTDSSECTATGVIIHFSQCKSTAQEISFSAEKLLELLFFQLLFKRSSFDTTNPFIRTHFVINSVHYVSDAGVKIFVIMNCTYCKKKSNIS